MGDAPPRAQCPVRVRVWVRVVAVHTCAYAAPCASARVRARQCPALGIEAATADFHEEAAKVG
ncbi:hypothetical protein ACFU93_29620 [Streptomyces sp. NPDC057611]|uniref:hypothetical protein n=1 Tax=Streptomyces sp. NPDC057611 TaxID=3346182 RepID=UPI0036753206